jgi:hypothetical protein
MTANRSASSHVTLFTLFSIAWPLSLTLGPPAAGEEACHEGDKPADDEVAGKAEVLRGMPKKFAAFRGADAGRGKVTLLLEEKLNGEQEAAAWKVHADAEVKVHGWWGRLEDLEEGDRVWAWFDVDRDKHPRSIILLADEVSEQDIHGLRPSFEAAGIEKRTLTLRSAAGQLRVLKLAEDIELKGAADGYDVSPRDPAKGRQPALRLRAGDKVFAQTAGESLRWLAGAEGLEALRSAQRAKQRARWRDEGLPGVVAFLHPLSGEMELMLDHEGMRWGRSLKPGEAVNVRAAGPGGAPLAAVVRDVWPWRERTRLRLVMGGVDQGELALGQRVGLLVPEPAPEVEASELPPDLDRPRTREERLDWFLASVYCTCNVGGDGCTGMFYTQASCNVNKCGMPRQVRARIAELIDSGKKDAEVFQAVKEWRGEMLFKPHLLK